MNAAVIIPAFNAGAFVREAIESALAQTLPPAQVVVVDDGSEDETAEITSSFGEKVRLVRQANAGLAGARNRGAAEADAEWLLFLDADDRLLPPALSLLQARQARSAQCRLVYGQAVLFEESTGRRTIHGDARSEGPMPTASKASFWKSALSTAGVAAIRADLYRELNGFCGEFTPTEDRDFWMKAGALTEFAFTGEPVLEKRIHGSNLSHQRGRLRIQGLRAQLAFPEWLRARGGDPSFLEATPLQVLEQNLARALENRSFDAVQWICDEAVRRQLSSPAVERARRLLAGPEWWRRAALFAGEQWRRLQTHG